MVSRLKAQPAIGEEVELLEYVGHELIKRKNPFHNVEIVQSQFGVEVDQCLNVRSEPHIPVGGRCP